MTANVSIIGEQRDNVLKINNAALRFRRPDATPAGIPAGKGNRGEHKAGRTVYLLRGTNPAAVQIRTGISDGVFTEVLDGLKEGDRVVTAVSGKTSQPAPASTNPFSGAPRRGF